MIMPTLEQIAEYDDLEEKIEEEEGSEIKKVGTTTGVYRITWDVVDQHLNETKQTSIKAKDVIRKIEQIIPKKIA